MSGQRSTEKDAPTGLVRVDSWKVVCDECRNEFEDYNGWTIFGEEWHAVESAQDGDWLVRAGLTLCVSCWEKKPYCRDEDNKCLRRDVSEADDGWLYCPDHIEQGMDAPTVTSSASTHTTRNDRGTADALALAITALTVAPLGCARWLGPVTAGALTAALAVVGLVVLCWAALKEAS